MTLRRFAQRLLAPFRKQRLDADLDEDIRAHLELAERDAIARGLTPEDARREALLAFGGIQPLKDEHRDRRSFPWMETLARDLRYAFTAVRHAPGFSAVVIGVLALGIGANVGMFSIVDAVLLKPLPFPDADHIVGVWGAPRPGVVDSTRPDEYLDWKRLGTNLEALSAEQFVTAVLTGQGEPARLPGKSVTADYFRVFPVPVQLGRTFTPEEDQPGAAPVIVLSHAAWQTYFGGDPAILTRRPVLNGEAHQVIGVLAPGAFDRDETRFWKPLIFTPQQLTAQTHWLTLFGRMRNGVTLAQVRDQMRSVHAAVTANAPPEERNGAITVEPLSSLLVGAGLQRSIYIAFGAVGLVLLIACANVANLLLAKGAARGRELAVRAALGAGRARLVCQLFTESLVLCVLGAVAGVAMAALFLRLATPVLATSLPYTAAVTLDLRVLAFAAALAFVVALIAGTLPAMHASLGDVAASLQQSGRASSGAHSRTRRVIVVAEVALSLVLLCGSILLLRSLLKLQAIETGIRAKNVVTMSLDLPPGTYRAPAQAALFYQGVADRLQSAPGIEQAGLATALPLEWISNGEAILVPGISQIVRVRFKRVDPGYFATLGIPVISGRGLTNRDVEGSPRVMVINQALAARLAEVAHFRNPVGQTVRVSTPGYLEQRVFLPDTEIVGVIRSERVAGPGYPDPAVVYVPLAQAPSPQVKLLVQSRTDVAAAMDSVRKAIHDLDPNLPIGDVATMDTVRSRSLSGASRPAWLIGIFAGIAVLLTAIGLYGVISYAVAQRRREIGIRMALGAGFATVVSQVMRNAFTLVAVGLVFGLGASVALTRVMKNLLYEVSPLDPLTLFAASAAMAFIGALAGLLPARRAARVDPVTTLREEG